MKKDIIVGYTTGVYDLFHIGHLRVLQRSKEHCDHLIVGVTTDELCFESKKKYPVVPFAERIEIVENIKCVDQVEPQFNMDKFAAWEKLRFNKMFVGDDWKGSDRWIQLEEKFAAVGVGIVYFPYTAHTSSTKLQEAIRKLS